MSRIHAVQITEEFVSISHSDEVDRDTGILETRITEIPQALLETSLLMDLVEAAEAILEEARVIKRQPAEQFTRSR